MDATTLTSIPSPSTQLNNSFLASALILLFLLATTTLVTQKVHSDYNDFISLGPGGTPSTVVGYLRIKFLGLFALKNPHLPAPIPLYLNRPAYITKLIKRPGSRPKVRGIAPHRQSDQKSSSEIFQLLREAILSLAAGQQQKLRHGTSCLEKHGPGLFALNPVNRSRHCIGEVCHAHPSDGSIHLTLHPADAAIVLQTAWGERHPLSSGGWLARFVPPGFVMVYAPRNEEEVEIVLEIVKAAVWWVAGVDVEDGVGTNEIVAIEEAMPLEYDCKLPPLVGNLAD